MSTPGQTSRSAAYWRLDKPMRAPIDASAVRYFVYTLLDASGEAVYVGRSCNVAARIKAHHGTIGHPFYARQGRESLWLLDARSLTMLGPFTWDEACRVERREIEKHQPRGNRMHTKAHGYRPLAEGGGRFNTSPP